MPAILAGNPAGPCSETGRHCKGSYGPGHNGETMADYVLVHGGNMSTETWNRLTIGAPVSTPDGLLGPKYWDGTVAVLSAAGHRVFAPALLDERSCHLVDHISQVCTLINKEQVSDVILVGHSYGGMVITGVADRMPDRIRRLVYLDAAVPDPGQSLYDLLEQGLRDAWGRTPELPEPSPPYVERIRFDPANLRRLKKTYIRCTKSDFAGVTRIAQEKIAASPECWTYLELPSSHVPMADMPEAWYRLILDAAE
ncbi:MAG: alpha/beta hydrolase [Methanomicrobiales archaeon]|nr:alpha/beta hydrolase [Methanomicrobiales archaeon]